MPTRWRLSLSVLFLPLSLYKEFMALLATWDMVAAFLTCTDLVHVAGVNTRIVIYLNVVFQLNCERSALI